MNAGWHIHSQGLIDLFRLRGSENYATQDGRYLYLLFFNSFVSPIASPLLLVWFNLLTLASKQIQSIRTGQESYITESITLLHEIADHCNSSEYIPLRTCILTYHCALLCSRIRKLLNEATDAELLSSSASILQDMDNVEKATYPLSHKSFITENVVEAPRPAADDGESSGEDTNQPMTVDSMYRGSIMYRVNWRIRVSFYVLEFLERASTSPNCTSKQRTLYMEYQLLCMKDLRILAERASFYLGTPYDKSKSFSELVFYIRTVLLPRTGPSDGIQEFVIEEPLEI